MDFVNNLNAVVSTVTGLIAIGTFVFGSVVYLLKRADAFRQRQKVQLTSSNGLHQTAAISLSKTDWWNVLWMGLEDCFKAKKGTGWISSIKIGVLGGLIVGMVSSVFGSGIFYVSITLFYTLFISMNLWFYVYFVEKRIEKKIEVINRRLAKKSKAA